MKFTDEILLTKTNFVDKYGIFNNVDLEEEESDVGTGDDTDSDDDDHLTDEDIELEDSFDNDTEDD